MTTATTNAQNQSFFSRVLTGLRAGYEAHARRMSRRDKIEALEALSDAELARRGIARHEIGHYVFRDLYYA